MRNKKERKVVKKTIFSLIIIFIFVIGIFIGLEISPKAELKVEEKLIDEKENKINLVGVNQRNEGVPGELLTNIRNGNGNILVNVNDVLAGVSLQNSARVAAGLAEEYTNISLDDYDITYSIKTNAGVIDGPSAGSSIAIATIALLEDKELNENVVISGSISDKGVLESVGGIVPKSDAAKEMNASLFLVPESTILSSVYKEEKRCGSLNGDEYCEVVYIEEDVDLGIQVKKVKDVQEALKYFYEGNF